MTSKTQRMGLMLVLAVAAAITITLHTRAADDKPATPATAPATTQAAEFDRNVVVITLGDDKITAGEFNDFINALPPQVQMMARTRKREVADEYITLRTLAKEAKAQKLDQTDKYKEQLAAAERQFALQKDNLLASQIVQQYQDKLDDAAAKKYFEAHKADFAEIKARHILISTRDGKSDAQAKAKADDIRKKLVDQKADFVKLVESDSDDPGSKANGGTYTFGHGQMTKAFEDVAFALKVNEISQPVKTEFGYHIIQLQERIEPTFEKVGALKIKQEAVRAYMKELKEKANPKLNDAFFDAKTPTAPAVPAVPGMPE